MNDESVLSVKESGPIDGGVYYTHATLISTGERTLPIDRIETLHDVAIATSSLSRYAIAIQDLMEAEARLMFRLARFC